MSADYLVIGHFDSAYTAGKAVRELRSRGHDKNLECYMPFPDHGLEEELYRGKKRSPVRMFTLLGGTTGCLGAFLFTSWMSVDYPLRVSAKPLISIPAFVVIAFECTILLGAIFTLLSMFHFSRIPSLVRAPGHRPQFTEGNFGIAVRCSKSESEEMSRNLSAWGAERVESQYVR